MEQTKEDMEIYLKEMDEQLKESKEREKTSTKALHQQMGLLDGEPTDNLIKWQLDLKEDMDRLYHLLRGDRIDYDEEGNIAYLTQENVELIPFSDFGVQLLMQVMSFYLNRNTILSNYNEATINWKVYDFGIEISDLIFNKYEVMMTTTKSEDPKVIRDHLKEKIKLYPMIVRELVDTVHSAYLRSLHGGERESLRTARTVTQNEPLGSHLNYQQSIQPTHRKTKVWNPATWGG